MGVFSWKCGLCKKPVINNMITNGATTALSDVVALDGCGDFMTGTYDGYGRVVDAGGVKGQFYRDYGSDHHIFHRVCVAALLESRPPSPTDRGQGHFYSNVELQEFLEGAKKYAEKKRKGSAGV